MSSKKTKKKTKKTKRAFTSWKFEMKQNVERGVFPLVQAWEEEGKGTHLMDSFLSLLVSRVSS